MSINIITSSLIRGYEVIIGFETHVQLLTKSKIFSRASTTFGAEPNTQACAIDLALPGTLPILNQKVVDHAITFGIAVHANIAPYSVFARKNYFYPDLPKGYQISQFEHPLVQGGEVSFLIDGTPKKIRLVRAHLEEDAGKSMHTDFVSTTSGATGKLSGIDLNRAGIPLLEIVTEPDLRSSEEAVAYARTLHTLVTWLGICDGNMQEGSFRCDANVSVRKPGQPLGTRREIKNLNSFKFLKQAIDYEVHWQIEQLDEGESIQQATVLFDPSSQETRVMRSKEDSADYRYFPDPDLPPLYVTLEKIAEIKKAMPELPGVMVDRLVGEYGLSTDDAYAITQSKTFAGYFEQTTQQCQQAKLVGNWLLGEFSRYLNNDNISIDTAPVTPKQLASLIRRIVDNTISHNVAKQVFQALWQGEGSDVDTIIQKKGLKQIQDSHALEQIVGQVLTDYPQLVSDYGKGKTKAFNALVGKVMQATKGKADPVQANALLKQKLDH